MRAAAAIVLLQLVVMLAGVVRGKALAVWLGPSGFGIAATIDQLVLTLAQIVQLSAPFTAMKVLSLAHSRGAQPFADTYRTFYRAYLPYALGVSALLVATLPWWLPRATPELAPHAATAVLAMLALPATMVQAFLSSGLAARQASSWSIGLTAVSGVLVAAAAAAGATRGLSGVYLASVPTLSLVVLAAAVVLRPRGAPSAASPAGGRVLTLWRSDPTIRVMALMGLAALTVYGALLFGIRYLALSHSGPRAAGLVQAAIAIAISLGAVVAPVSSTWLAPYLNRAVAPGEKVAATHAFVQRLTVALAAGCAAVTLLPEFVLGLLFSREFHDAAPLVLWFALWQLLLQPAQVYQFLLLGLDDIVVGTSTIIVGHVVSIVMALLLVGRFGEVGVGMGVVAGGIASAAGALWRVRAHHGFAVPLAVLGRWAWCCALVVASALAWHTMPAMALRALAGLALGAGLWIGLPASDRRTLVGLATRRRGHSGAPPR
jgi:O-antigen/teichoic acid export membrane protein